jgi:hypothetical protein
MVCFGVLSVITRLAGKTLRLHNSKRYSDCYKLGYIAMLYISLNPIDLVF